MVMNKIIMKA